MEEKQPKVGKPRDITKKITECARKHNLLNYKSNVPLGFNLANEQELAPTRPSIRVVGKFG